MTGSQSDASENQEKEYTEEEVTYSPETVERDIVDEYVAYERMPPTEDMSEEEWKQLTDLQREEIIEKYNSKREKDKEIEMLRNRKRNGRERRGSGEEEAIVAEGGRSKKLKKSRKRDYDIIDDDIISEEEEAAYREEKEKPKKPRNTRKPIEEEDMRQLLFTRDQLLDYIENPFFDMIVKNGFILHRENLQNGIIYLIRQIIDVKECYEKYFINDIPCNKILVVVYGDGQREIELSEVSNSKIEPEDFENYMNERNDHGEAIMTKAECEQRCNRIKELETKVPTEKDLVAILARRQLTINVHHINTVRLEGDLLIRKERLENEIHRTEEMATAKHRAYTELDEKKNALEKEIKEIEKRMEEIKMEERERVRMRDERDQRLKRIAEKNREKNHELYKQTNKKQQKLSYMSRQPTLPSVSWSTGNAEEASKGAPSDSIPKETPRDIPKETPRDIPKETPKDTPSDSIPKETRKETRMEDIHKIEFSLPCIDPNLKKEAVLVEENVKKNRKGMSLTDYLEHYG